jgi:hypothetical protein
MFAAPEFCGDGVSPAGLPYVKDKKTADGTPAPPNKKNGATVFSVAPPGNVFFRPYSVYRVSCFLPVSRIRSVNFSPLGAASQSFADSLSFLLRVCAPEVKN